MQVRIKHSPAGILTLLYDCAKASECLSSTLLCCVYGDKPPSRGLLLQICWLTASCNGRVYLSSELDNDYQGSTRVFSSTPLTQSHQRWLCNTLLRHAKLFCGVQATAPSSPSSVPKPLTFRGEAVLVPTDIGGEAKRRKSEDIPRGFSVPSSQTCMAPIAVSSPALLQARSPACLSCARTADVSSLRHRAGAPVRYSTLL